MKKRTKAFTIVELLVVMGIIALLLSLALPAFNTVRIKAREVRDKAALNTIATALESFSTDMGHYPDSQPRKKLLMQGGFDNTVIDDQGAHILFESLAGLDMIGYQKDHHYEVSNAGIPIDSAGMETKRYGPYLQLDSVKFGNLMEDNPNYNSNSNNNNVYDNDNNVFYDTIDPSNALPILYYRARTTGRTISDIYNFDDNLIITEARDDKDNPLHPLFDTQIEFAEYIYDSKTFLTPGFNIDVNPTARPYKADSFILINPGIDRQYGTQDDICNFTKRDD